MFKKITFYLLAALALRVGSAGASPLSPAPRVYSTADHAFLTFEGAVEQLAEKDVVFVGEIHDNNTCHTTELALLQGLFARHPHLALAMEMFERDVQPVLDGYMAGTIPADSFLADARPWPNYATDYSPLVEFARTRHLEIIASNTPTSLAQAVARHGLPALREVPVHVLRYFARQTTAPQDQYFQLFTQAMGAHMGVHGSSDALARFYEAQCLKDDTMAESVADYLLQTGPDHALVLHLNGAFHTDYGLGTAARTRSRLPDARISVVSMIAVDDPAQIPDLAVYKDQGDYLIFVPKD